MAVAEAVNGLEKMETLTEARTGEKMVINQNIAHNGAAFWYAARVGFDAGHTDPDGTAEHAVGDFVKRHHSLFFFNNGNPRKMVDYDVLLEPVVKPFI